jgi:hypothetical protein
MARHPRVPLVLSESTVPLLCTVHCVGAGVWLNSSSGSGRANCNPAPVSALSGMLGRHNKCASAVLAGGDAGASSGATSPVSLPTTAPGARSSSRQGLWPLHGIEIESGPTRREFVGTRLLGLFQALWAVCDSCLSPRPQKPPGWREECEGLLLIESFACRIFDTDAFLPTKMVPLAAVRFWQAAVPPEVLCTFW